MIELNSHKKHDFLILKDKLGNTISIDEREVKNLIKTLIKEYYTFCNFKSIEILKDVNILMQYYKKQRENESSTIRMKRWKKEIKKTGEENIE